MKIKKPQTNGNSEDVAARLADRFGNDYENASNNEKLSAAHKAKARAGIIDIGRTYGKQNGKEKVVAGKFYTVGVLEKDGGQEFDRQGFFASLDVVTRTKVGSMQLDDKKLEQAIKRKLITNAQLAKFIKQRPSVNMVVCRASRKMKK